MTDIRTGWPPGLMQDDDRRLSRALADTPHARRLAEEAAAIIRDHATDEVRIERVQVIDFCREPTP